MDRLTPVGPSSSESADPMLDRLLTAQAHDAAAEIGEEHDPRECYCNDLPSPCVDCRAVFDRQRAERAAPPLSSFNLFAVRRSLAAARVRGEGQ